MDNYQITEKVQKAENLISQGLDNEAKDIYLELSNYEQIAGVANFRLGEIENRNKNIENSYVYHKKAFEADKMLASRITHQEHISHNYLYEKVEEIKTETCPLCGGSGEKYSCYNMVTNIDFIQGFNPIRLWKICKVCNHIFADSYPKDLEKILVSSMNKNHTEANVLRVPLLGETFINLKKYTKGNKLLEVGVGAGEMTAVAKEMQFDVIGIDIRPLYAQKVSDLLNISVHATDFMKFNIKSQFDIIILGDVIEHLANPIAMLQKASSLLTDDGLLWISTPNFESAYSYIVKDKDFMWRVCEHLNYFSYTSLKKVLENLGFEVVDYQISKHYNGSMEVIALKK